MPRVDAAAIARFANGASRKASSSSCPLQPIMVGLCWLGFTIMCLVLLGSNNDEAMQTILGVCLGFASTATCVYFVCMVYTTNQTKSRLTAVKQRQARHLVDPLTPCALCGLYLGELCNMHRREAHAASTPKRVLCPVSRGKCGHTYHFHCIATHLDQCAASGRNATCPDVSDVFLWEWDTREDKGRYQQWMSERPIHKRRLRQQAATKQKSPKRGGSQRDLLQAEDAGSTWPAPNPAVARQGSGRRILARQNSSSRSIGRRPDRTVPVPPRGASSRARRNRVMPSEDAATSPTRRRSSREVLGGSLNSRSMGRLRSRSGRQLEIGAFSPSSHARRVSPPHRTLARQIPQELHRMKTSLEVAREEAARAKLQLEKEAAAKRLHEERSRAAVRNAQAAWQKQTQTVEELKEAMEQLQDARLCPVCIEDPKDTAFQCGHQVCHTCSPALEKCPICRAEVTMRIKLYH